MLFSASTISRSNIWKNDISLWNDVLKKYPDDARSYMYLGVAYFQRKKFKKAEGYYLLAAEKWSSGKHLGKNLARAYSYLQSIH